MASVSADVAALVVRVDGEVEAHELRERSAVVAQHGGEVGRPVLGRVDAADLAVSVEVAVDGSGKRGQLGYQVHGVFVGILCSTQREREREREKDRKSGEFKTVSMSTCTRSVHTQRVRLSV